MASLWDAVADRMGTSNADRETDLQNATTSTVIGRASRGSSRNDMQSALSHVQRYEID